MTDDDLATYYRLRTHEYDRVYAKPERQSDLDVLEAEIRVAVVDRHVLELAAGTGYWTPTIASAARSLLATDISAETLLVAQQRDYEDANIEFLVADALSVAAVEGHFDCIVAGFFLSHVERHALDDFLAAVLDRVRGGGRVLLFDNNYVHGSSHPTTGTSSRGDTYQTRTLDNGATFSVLKNFYRREELIDLGRRHAPECRVRSLEYFWLMQLDDR